MKKINAKIKFKSFEEVFRKDFLSKSFKKAYDEEFARLKLAEQIKKMRLHGKFTQKMMAQKAKMPQSVIARIESGTHGYSLGTLSRIAHVFHKEIKLV